MTLGERQNNHNYSKCRYEDFKSVLDDPAAALILLTRESLDLHDIKSVENYLRHETDKIEEEIKWDKSIKSTGARKWKEHYEKVRPVYENISRILEHRSTYFGDRSPEERAMKKELNGKLEELDQRSRRLYQPGHSPEDISKFCDVYFELDNIYEEIVSA